MRSFLNKNWLTILFSLLVSGIFFAYPAAAGTLSCTVRAGSCNGGETNVFNMSNTGDAHASLANQVDYGYFVCCGSVVGLGTTCGTGTSVTLLNLAKQLNSHVQVSGSYAYPVCLSVPTGGSISTGTTSTGTCAAAGYDTTVASLAAASNSHVGASTAYTLKICASAHQAGQLTTDIVDAGEASVASPTIGLSSFGVSFSKQTVTGTFGVAAQKVHVFNSTINPRWTLALAATSGPTALWTAGANHYDFNDPTANAADGPDADTYGGQMTVNPAAGTLTPMSGCANTGVTIGSSSAFSEGVTNSVTLLTAGSSAAIDCYWDLTGVGISQTVPAEQPAGSYALNMTLTVTAN